MTKEEFNKLWKDSTREEILNQYYYDYKELQRLNNIINELEKYLIERIEYNDGSELQDYLVNTYSIIYSVLLELKGDSSNENI